MGHKIKVCIIHPMDPLGSKIGGIGTFIRGFVKHAPRDFEIEWVGVTSDRESRPVGRWQEISLERKRVQFFPLLYVFDENKRQQIPITLKFTASLYLYGHRVILNDQDFMFHRVEPVLPFRAKSNRKVLFIHGNMQDLYSLHTEVKWKSFPWAYFQLEKRIVASLDKIFVVREDAVNAYRDLYPHLADRFSFIPTWVDEETFQPTLNDRDRLVLRHEHGFTPDDRLILFAGRLEGPKDPFLLLDAFEFIHRRVPSARLLIAGTGSLQSRLVSRVKDSVFGNHVRFFGALPQPQVAELLRMGDAFLLTSAFEGMPKSVLEALACGLPVVATPVGEVKRVVIPGVSGKIVYERTPEALGAAVLEILTGKEKYSVPHCVSSISDYQASKVLTGVYETYYGFYKTDPSSLPVD